MDSDSDSAPKDDVAGLRPRPRGADYYLTREILLRGLGALYFVAFAILIRQGPGLIGARGLLPVEPFLAAVAADAGGRTAAALRLPTLFWFGASDAALEALSWLGLALAALVTLGIANLPIALALWALYLSFVHVGQVFYGYGWETLLCEAGFLAVFLAPALRPELRRALDPPPYLVIVLFRWLVFRVMFGAGLIKLRGDPCWTELSCLEFHYETQPNPGPLSPYFHFMPRWFHQGGVLFNHAVELVAPFFVFGPRPARLVAGAAIVSFQAILMLSGNLSFLNWLTLVVALACFDDRLLSRLGTARAREALGRLADSALALSGARAKTLVALGVVIGLLSLNPVVNLLSSRQRMNASFDPLGLVNTYGAFGSVGRVRREVVIEGTRAAEPGPDAVWLEYEFPCKPGSVIRRPCLITPYHHRLDWQMWFAGLSNFRREPWILHLVYKLLRGEREIDVLLAKNPFGSEPPRHVRALAYYYRFAPLGDEGLHWERELEGEFLPPVSLEHEGFRRLLAAYGWLERG